MQRARFRSTGSFRTPDCRSHSCRDDPRHTLSGHRFRSGARKEPYALARRNHEVILLRSGAMQGAAPGLATAIHEAYIRAHNAFIDFETYLHTSQDDQTAYYGHETDEAVRELALKLVAAFEYLRMPETGARFRVAVEGLSATAASYSDEMGGLYPTTLEIIRPYVEIVEAVAGVPRTPDATAQVREVLEQILRSTARYLFLRGVDPQSEPHLQKEIYPLLKAAFPDTTREVPLPHVAKTYKADFGVPSQGTLIELKYCDSKSDWPKALDGVYADMKGYSGSQQWRHFYVVFYLTDRFTTQEEVEAEFLATSSGGWKPLVVFGNAAASD